MLKMTSAYELGRAINPKMVEQQLVGGAWMGMSHALYETPEPYYPDTAHGPRDFNEYVMPGPGDICPHDIAVLERPAPDGPFGGKGPGEMCANPVLPAVANAIFNAVGVRIDELPITPEKVLRGLKAQGGARPKARRKAALAMVVRAKSPASTARRRWRTRSATRLLSGRRQGSRRPPTWRWRWASRCCSKARRASARPRPPRPSRACSARRLIRLQCYEGIDAAAALYEWNYPRQMLAIRQAGDQPVDIYRDEFLIERPMLQALRAPDERRAADRRDRPLRPRVRGVAAGVPVRLHDLDPRARHAVGARAPGRDPHLQPHARAARGAAAPLRLPLDRVSRAGARGADHHAARLHRRRGDRARASSPPSAGCGASRSPSRPASPRPSTGRRPRPCWRRAARPGRMPSSAPSASRSRTRTTSPTWRRGSTPSSRRPRHERAALPDAVAPFVAFATLLRANGFAVAPEQTHDLPVRHHACSGPRSLDRHPPRGPCRPWRRRPERHEEFDALFDAHFLGAVELGRELAEPDPDDMRVQEDRAAASSRPPRDDDQRGGPGRHRR